MLELIKSLLKFIINILMSLHLQGGWLSWIQRYFYTKIWIFKRRVYRHNFTNSYSYTIFSSTVFYVTKWRWISKHSLIKCPLEIKHDVLYNLYDLQLLQKLTCTSYKGCPPLMRKARHDFQKIVPDTITFQKLINWLY